MKNNITTMLTATQMSRLAPNPVVAVRLRAVAAEHGAAEHGAANAAVATVRAIPGPVAWGPPAC